jgi:hypothetical protein
VAARSGPASVRSSLLGPADVPAKVAWRSDRDGDYEVYVAKTDGTWGLVNVSSNGAFDEYPSLQGL